MAGSNNSLFVLRAVGITHSYVLIVGFVHDTLYSVMEFVGVCLPYIGNRVAVVRF